MPGQHLVLLDRRIQAEPECGVPSHHTISLPQPTDNNPSPGGEVSGRRDHRRSSSDPDRAADRRCGSGLSDTA